MTKPDPEPGHPARGTHSHVRLYIWCSAVGTCLFLAFIYHIVGPRLTLDVYLRDLAHQGERLSTIELTEPAPVQAVVAASEFLRLAKQLPPAPPAQRTGPPSHMAYIAPGIARASWQETHVPVRFPGHASAGNDPAPLTWEELDTEIAPYRQLLHEIQICLAAHSFDWNIDYHLAPRLLLPHLGTQKRVAQWFVAVVSNDLYARRMESAHRALVAQITLAGQLETDRTVISQLVANALASVSFGSTWEAWQADGWSDPQLAQLQGAWSRTHFYKPMLNAMEMDRAMGRLTFDYCRQNPHQVDDITGGLGPVFPPDTRLGALVESLPLHGSGYMDDIRLWLWRWRGSYIDERIYLELCQADLQVLRDPSPLHAKLASLNSLEASHATTKSRLLFEDFRSPAELIVKKVANTECLRSLVIVAIALKRHIENHGAYPDSLEQLVPAFLAEVPIDPFDARPLRYRREANNQFTLYSVGVNGIDDGGDPEPSPAERRANFLTHGKDIVWPWPPPSHEP